MKKYIISIFFLFFIYNLQSQVLIALLLGDKLNNGKMEFGLDGGLNFSSISELDANKWKRDFNLGFYFDIKIKNQRILDSHKYLKDKSIEKIKQSQMLATEKVFTVKKIPFRTFKVFKRTEQALGELFCFFILETILLGRALKINPFDQPSVELIKKETKNFLI